MNAGILPQSPSPVAMPYKLLGSPQVIPTTYGKRQEWHPDVANWMQRATNNGGQFSYRTLLALQSLCVAIDAAGIRSLLLRLNVFAGANLQAALTPLYVAAAATNATLGNAIDANNNFVGNDYTEYGADGGLLGNGSNKYLNTGFLIGTAGIASLGHMSIYHAAYTPAANQMYMGCLNDGFSQYFFMGTNGSATALINYWGGTLNLGASLSTAAQHSLVTRTASNRGDVYRNGSGVQGNNNSVSASDPVRPIFVFARNQGGSAVSPAAFRLRCYSIGGAMSSGNVFGFYSALSAYCTAMERTPV